MTGLRATLKRLLADTFVRLAGAIAVLAAVPYVVPFLSPGAQSAYGGLYAPAPFHILSVVAAVTAARREQPRRARQFWLLIAVAVTCWQLNNAIDIALGGRALPGLMELASDVLFVGFYLFMALALEQEPHHSSRPERLLSVRRAATAVFAFSLLVYFAVLPAAVNVEAYLTWLPSLLLYVVLDLYVLMRVVMLWRECSEPLWRDTYLLLAVTAALWLGNDSLEVLATAGVMPLAPPGHPVDVLFYPKFFTLIAATRLGAGIVRDPAGEPTRDDPELPATEFGGGPLVAYIMILPILHYALYSTGLLDEVTRPAREAWIVVALVALAGLGIVYQRRMVEENSRLWIRSQAMVERLQAGERLEAIGRLAGGIAHDFNNILTVIIGNADLARASMASENPKTRRYVDSVGGAAARGAELVKKLLGFGRRDLVVAQPTDLAAFAKRVGQEWSRVLPESLTLSFDAAQDTPAVLIDTAVFEQVLVNLLTNARDSMPLGGEVRIETLSEVLTADDAERLGGSPGAYGCLRVRDAGGGMDSETLARVFEPFFTTKPPGAGAGMGLSMVYGIVKQHDGLIDVRSAPGQGTVVTICLPVCSGPPETAREPAAPAAGGTVTGTETILLVEDEPGVAEMAADLLEAHEYTVVRARDGVEACEIFERMAESIDLVISDVVMPRLGGPALLERIRKTHPHLPFMFVSGHAPELYDAHGELDPAVPFIAKPWHNDQFLREVRRTLDTGHARL